MLEVFEEISSLFNQPPQIYSFERALQAPYLEMMQRGFLVDELARRQAVDSLRARELRLQATLNEMAQAACGHSLNPRSPAQLKDFFYSSLKLPEVWLSQKGERKLSTNREALEKLDSYLYARPFVSAVLGLRDLAKQREVLETEIDRDGRIRTSYNIAGTETGRPSSSSNAFGTGGNLQNVALGLRYVFVADPGWKLVVIDLEQVEARDVGWFCGVLFNDWSYLDACESGDLHTSVCKLVWPRELKWTGVPDRDKWLADSSIFYRDFSYRFMSKRGAHLSNYMGTAWTAARVMKMPIATLEEFQARYILGRAQFTDKKGTFHPAIVPAFPCIPRWWQWIAQQIQTPPHSLTTPFGRTRHFFGRPGDDTTLREAIAYMPQSTTADRMNLGLWRIWKHMPQVQLLGQGYDSVTFQVQDDSRFDEVVAEALELIKVPLEHQGRRYICPGEAKVGWNWGSMHDASKPLGQGNKFNPDGLVKWQPGQDRRQRQVGIKRIMA